MICIENLYKRLGKFELKDINIRIPEGYICGLVGRNGAGKTSLIHTLLGLYAPNSGAVTIDAMSYENQEIEIRNQFGIVLCEDTLRPELTLKDNGSFYGAYYRNFNQEQYITYLEEFKLEPKQAYGRLSRGQKMKAQFAFALAINPKYLIMDEPTANFDPEFKEIFLRKIRAFVSNSKNTVLLSTHMTEDLESTADYLIYMDQGQIIYSGDIESFRDKYRLVYGDQYRLKTLGKKRMLAMEESQYSCKALVLNDSDLKVDANLKIAIPTIEDFMYMYSRRENNETNFVC